MNVVKGNAAIKAPTLSLIFTISVIATIMIAVIKILNNINM